MRASGHAEIEGFLANSVLRLSGYKTDKQQPEEEEKKELLKRMDTSLVQFLRKTFPDWQVTVSPATAFRQG